MSGFGDFSFSLYMRDTIQRLAEERIEALRPRYRYGTVSSIDRVNRKCGVTLNGETAPVIVNMGSIQPAVIGQTVRVEGLRGDRFITDVMGLTYNSLDNRHWTHEIGGVLVDCNNAGVTVGGSSFQVIKRQGTGTEFRFAFTTSAYVESQGTVNYFIIDPIRNISIQVGVFFYNQTLVHATVAGGRRAFRDAAAGTYNFELHLQTIVSANRLRMDGNDWTYITCDEVIY